MIHSHIGLDVGNGRLSKEDADVDKLSEMAGTPDTDCVLESGFGLSDSLQLWATAPRQCVSEWLAE